MKIRCKYCDNYIDDTDETCPHCGGVNTDLKRVGDGVPTTIEELKLWYKEHNLPDENITRFFIGKDIKEPRAFGIFYNENTKKYTVYKNKANGQRAIRYEGKDEKYAVNELYLRLKEEIVNQKSNNINKNVINTYSQTNYRRTSGGSTGVLKLVIGIILFYILVFCIIPVFVLGKVTSRYYSPGYYEYKNTYYYLIQDGEDCWYKLDDVNGKWETYDISKLDKEFTKHKRDYYVYSGPENNKFEDSGYYLDNCDEGLRYYNTNVYYLYDGNIYEYKNGDWSKINRKDYDTVNANLRQNCNDATYRESNGMDVKDFRSTSYYIPKNGYYIYEDVYYYYFQAKSTWYKYNGTSWVYTSKFSDDFYLYYATSTFSTLPYFYVENGEVIEDHTRRNTSDVDDFTYSSAYKDYYYRSSSSSYDNDDDWGSSSSWDSDWDSGSSWDSSDSWDSGGTDWDSDW